MERVLVVGAGGTVGRAAMAAIDAHPLLTGIAGLRRAGGAPNTRVVDATDIGSLTAALQGCTLAVNAVGGAPATLLAATRALCQAAQVNGVRRLVHVSSMAVYGSEAAGTLQETAAFAAAPSPYEAAKIACEAEMQSHVAAGGQAVIIRPGLVFGPGSPQWATRIAGMLRAGRLGDLGPAGDGFCNLTYQPDLGAGIVSALLAPQACGLAFNLASAAPPTWNEFLIRFARALGATPVRRITGRRLAIESLLAPALQACRVAASRVGRSGLIPDPLSPSLRRLFGQRMRLDPALADRVLAFARTPDDRAIDETAAALHVR